MISGHERTTHRVAAHFLNKRLHLVIERVRTQHLCRRAARLDELLPLVAADAPTGRGDDLLHHVRFAIERCGIVRAAALFDRLQHVDELLFVVAALLGAEQRIVRELHFRERRQNHFRVMLVVENRHGVTHEREVFRRADAV
ncbi:hypothetical protein [Burkholderia sp. B21-007]|uniref:hypothetical protein n=1 Tax=Burkholderia sp. B21-007 TaxID=2890407 RepID=UPI001E471EF3|nr:hypothetical protein [Burkholderia sp. B21-007]UEP31743.1 hypothetical protein LMA01_21330 [Burkholderia sp. B21-007]